MSLTTKALSQVFDTFFDKLMSVKTQDEAISLVSDTFKADPRGGQLIDFILLENKLETFYRFAFHPYRFFLLAVYEYLLTNPEKLVLIFHPELQRNIYWMQKVEFSAGDVRYPEHFVVSVANKLLKKTVSWWGLLNQEKDKLPSACRILEADTKKATESALEVLRPLVELPQPSSEALRILESIESGRTDWRYRGLPEAVIERAVEARESQKVCEEGWFTFSPMEDCMRATDSAIEYLEIYVTSCPEASKLLRYLTTSDTSWPDQLAKESYLSEEVVWCAVSARDLQKKYHTVASLSGVHTIELTEKDILSCLLDTLRPQRHLLEAEVFSQLETLEAKILCATHSETIASGPELKEALKGYSIESLSELIGGYNKPFIPHWLPHTLKNVRKLALSLCIHITYGRRPIWFSKTAFEDFFEDYRAWDLADVRDLFSFEAGQYEYRSSIIDAAVLQQAVAVCKAVAKQPVRNREQIISKLTSALGMVEAEADAFNHQIQRLNRVLDMYRGYVVKIATVRLELSMVIQELRCQIRQAQYLTISGFQRVFGRVAIMWSYAHRVSISTPGLPLLARARILAHVAGDRLGVDCAHTVICYYEKRIANIRSGQVVLRG